MERIEYESLHEPRSAWSTQRRVKRSNAAVPNVPLEEIGESRSRNYMGVHRALFMPSLGRGAEGAGSAANRDNRSDAWNDVANWGTPIPALRLRRLWRALMRAHKCQTFSGGGKDQRVRRGGTAGPMAEALAIRPSQGQLGWSWRRRAGNNEERRDARGDSKLSPRTRLKTD